MAEHLRIRKRLQSVLDAGEVASVAQWVLSERDQLSRKLRISLVDSCNLGCFFCHNDGQGALGRSRGVISADEFRSLIRAAARAGVCEVKLTGGEPLLYRVGLSNTVDLVRRLADLRCELPFGLSMTTNGLLLDGMVGDLAQAGLDRVTVSLHTLDPSTFGQAVSSRSPESKLRSVRAGVRSAVLAGLNPVKINMVLFAGDETTNGNLDEIAHMVGFARSQGVAELRLYTLQQSHSMSRTRFDSNYQFWTRQFVSSLASRLSPDRATDIESAINDFVDRWRATLYPKPRLLLDLDGLAVSIETMEDGRFEALGLPAEGPYAMRMSADGWLRGSLSDVPTVNPLHMLRSGCSERHLVAAFENARQQLLPRELAAFAPSGL